MFPTKGIPGGCGIGVVIFLLYCDLRNKDFAEEIVRNAEKVVRGTEKRWGRSMHKASVGPS